MLKGCLLGFLVFATTVYLIGSGFALTGVTIHHINAVDSANHISRAHDNRESEISSAVTLINNAQVGIDTSIVGAGSST